MRFDTDRRYTVPLAPLDLWEAAGRVDRYRDWWPWLRRLDAVELAADQVWRCTVRPPLPYRVRVELRLLEVEPGRLVRASVAGDVVGDAHVEIRPADAGSEVRFRSSLEPASGFLRSLSRVASPLARYGHDWVIDTGARQFVDGLR